jgi:hypothetical protein
MASPRDKMSMITNMLMLYGDPTLYTSSCGVIKGLYHGRLPKSLIIILFDNNMMYPRDILLK